MWVELGRDEWELEGFTCFPGMVRSRRSELGGGKGQGMAIWVHQSMADFATVASSTDHYMFIRLAVPACKPIFVGCVYLPPAGSAVEWGGSRELWLEAWGQLQTETQQLMALGEVCLLGDFNAHSSSCDDRGGSSAQVFDDLGVPGPHVARVAMSIPPRFNPDVSGPDGFGMQLIQLCSATGCLILNGRIFTKPRASVGTAPADHPSARFTCWGRRADGPSTVVDYVLVSGGLFPHVRSFAVGDFDLSCSDHAPLLVSLELPMSAAAVSATPAAAKPPTFPAIKWDKARRAEYTEAVTRNFHRRSCVLDRLNDGGDVSVVAQEWCQLLIDSAVEVFGVCQVGGKMLDGRPAKAWFKNCRAEWLVLRAAIRRGDTHVAKVAKRAFNAAKRRAKRHCAKQWQARLWDDIQHNPRRFWTAYRGKRMDCMLSDFRAVDRHWRLLFGSSGQHSLPECAVSAADFVSELVGSLPDSVQSGAAAALNAPFENDIAFRSCVAGLAVSVPA